MPYAAILGLFDVVILNTVIIMLYDDKPKISAKCLCPKIMITICLLPVTEVQISSELDLRIHVILAFRNFGPLHVLQNVDGSSKARNITQACVLLLF